MLIGRLTRVSSNEDEAQDANIENSDDVMVKALSKKLASLSGQLESQADSYSDYEHLGLDDLSTISRNLLMDKNLEVSKVRVFSWSMIETYVERFQVYPFDEISELRETLKYAAIVGERLDGEI